jgi:hypothetical protein
MIKWEHMELAPKDGTRVLVHDGKNIEIAWFGSDNHDFLSKNKEWLYGTGDDFSTGYYFNPIDPIGWMHLPTIPINESTIND